ncbi:hypothetical protein OSB04_001491 [Centaurea solstitialis]|uniref:Uncharacterized protein n=1 Tax=Centaurea solstitialis TaxID=347529 RepID=A0AA38U2T0_9ASTR|nr:hypothetical protein OSB04_001491 [Centaurea solstitialis]
MAVGAGMQGTVAIVNLVCFYVIGVPMGALLGYLTSLKVKGIWLGMIGGVVTQTLALVYMACRTDWDDQVKRASERLNRFYVKSSDEPEQTSIIVVIWVILVGCSIRLYEMWGHPLGVKVSGTDLGRGVSN